MTGCIITYGNTQEKWVITEHLIASNLPGLLQLIPHNTMTLEAFRAHIPLRINSSKSCLSPMLTKCHYPSYVMMKLQRLLSCHACCIMFSLIACSNPISPISSLFADSKTGFHIKWEGDIGNVAKINST